MRHREDNFLVELDGQACISSMDRSHSELPLRTSQRSRPEPPVIPHSLSTDENSDIDGGIGSHTDTIQTLLGLLEEKERLCESLQHDLEEKNQQIAILRGELQEALKGQVEAENNTIASHWETRYLSLRDILRRSEEEKRQLTHQLDEAMAKEWELRRELRRARGELEGQTERETAMQRREMAENNNLRLVNAIIEPNNSGGRDGAREQSERSVSDSQNTAQQSRGAYSQRSQRSARSSTLRVVTVRGSQVDSRPTHLMVRSRPATSAQALMFG